MTFPESQQPGSILGLNERPPAAAGGSSFNTTEVLTDLNRSRFEKFKDGAKSIATKAYEGIYKIPGVSRVVGKMEIAYDQVWIDRHQEKAAESKVKMDSIDMSVGVLEEAKSELLRVVQELREGGTPGAESIEVKIAEIDRKKEGLLNKKDKEQSKVEKRQNKANLRTNERNKIADKLIDRYEEKLAPMEEKLSGLNKDKNRADLFIRATEIKHKRESDRLDEIEKRRKTVSAALKKAGLDAEKNEAVVALNDLISSGRNKLKAEMEKLDKKREEIKAKIAKVDGKANKFRDKREEFLRIKARKPVQIRVPERERGENTNTREGVRSHTRAEAVDGNESTEERREVGALLNSWNDYIRNKFGEESMSVIHAEDFLSESGFDENIEVTLSDFKDIVSLYYQHIEHEFPGDFELEVAEFGDNL